LPAQALGEDVLAVQFAVLDKVLALAPVLDCDRAIVIAHEALNLILPRTIFLGEPKREGLRDRENDAILALRCLV